MKAQYVPAVLRSLVQGPMRRAVSSVLILGVSARCCCPTPKYAGASRLLHSHAGVPRRSGPQSYKYQGLCLVPLVLSFSLSPSHPHSSHPLPSLFLSSLFLYPSPSLFIPVFLPLFLSLSSLPLSPPILFPLSPLLSSLSLSLGSQNRRPGSRSCTPHTGTWRAGEHGSDLFP